MMNFFRSLFGLNKSSENRTVVGNAVSVDAKDVQYIQNSNARLHALQNLYSRYKGTPHEQKLEIVFEKTKHIHHYLLSRKRAHELEMFHVRNTDHFINTFTVILDVHQRHTATTFATLKEAPKAYRGAPPIEQPSVNRKQPQFETKVDTVLKRIESETIKGIYTAQKVSEMVKRVAGQAPYVQTDVVRPPIPTVSVPIISIDTYSKVTYVREEAADVVSGEIGFTSSAEEMETFVTHVSARLGIDRSVLSYSGNAMVAIPDRKGPNPARYVPIVNWKGCTYALNLNDYLLFPVRAYRRSH